MLETCYHIEKCYNTYLHQTQYGDDFNIDGVDGYDTTDGEADEEDDDVDIK